MFYMCFLVGRMGSTADENKETEEDDYGSIWSHQL